MKNWKSLPVLLLTLLTIACLNTSCKEDRAVIENENYEVDVAIISPDNNAIMSVGENFNVEVDYARNGNTIHNIKVEILDMNGNLVQKLVERHAHVANEFTFKMDDIKIDQMGTYIVRASSTDLHDGEGENQHGAGNEDHNNRTEHTFTIQ